MARAPGPHDRRAIDAAYDHLLRSIGDAADAIGDAPLTSFYAEVGSAYRGTVIVGQAVYGWDPTWRASDARVPTRRAEILVETAAVHRDRPEPMDWIEGRPANRSSPFWQAHRRLAERLEPDLDAPWYGRFAWLNLYPVAPQWPDRGNPRGALREAQDPHVVPLLEAWLEALDARRIVVFAGEYWWVLQRHPSFAALPEDAFPLKASGRVGGRPVVVGAHPTGASRRGFGPSRYVELIAERLAVGPATRSPVE